MKRTTKSIIAFLVLVAMCVSFCVPTFAEVTEGEHAELHAVTDKCPGHGNYHTLDNSTATKVGNPVPVKCGANNGYTLYECNVCNDRFAADIVVAPSAHDYEEEKFGASCTEPGKIVRTCKFCGFVEEEEVAELGHSWGEWYYADGVFCDETGREYVRDCEKCDAQDKDDSKFRADEDHVWELTGTDKLPVCVTPGWAEFKCKECNATKKVEIKAEYTSHNFASWDNAESIKRPATCQKAGIAVVKCQNPGCTKTKEVSIPTSSVEHQYGPVASKEPTCTEVGYTEGIACTVCGDIKTAQNTIPALGHDIENHDAKVPSCTEIGWDAYETCTRCDYTTYVEIPAVGHSYTNGENGTVDNPTSIVEPTCQNYGWKFYACVNCGSEEEDDILTKRLDKVPHNDKTIEVVVAGDCTTDREYYTVCDYVVNGKVCGHRSELVVETAPGHNYVATTYPATCIAEGKIVYECSECSDSYEEVIPGGINANFHEVNKNTDGKANQQITTAPTCTEYGQLLVYCPSCGYVKSYGAADDVEGVSAEVEAYLELIRPAVHDWQVIEGDASYPHVEATCGTPETWYEKCSKCFEVSEQKVGESNGHKLAVTGVENATCTTDAKLVYTCSVCTTYTEEVTGTDIDAEDAKANLNLDKNGNPIVVKYGHNYDGQMIEANYQTPNCSGQLAGWNMPCNNSCGTNSFLADVTNPYDRLNPEHHTADTWMTDANGDRVVFIPGTCTVQGYYWNECTGCGEKYHVVADDNSGKGCEYYKSNEIPAKTKTCYSEGFTAGYTCSSCGTVYAPVSTGFAAHSWTTDKAVAPTCTSTGLTQGKHCKIAACGYVDVAQEVVPALGHNIVTDAAVAATCTETGLTEGKHCDRCNDTTIAEYVAQTVVSALGHTEEVVPGFAATCVDAGKTDGVVCTVCNVTLTKQTTIKALGHTIDESVYTKYDATCQFNGYYLYTCSACSDKDDMKETKYTRQYITNYGGKLEHSEVKSDVLSTAPKCDAEGEDVYVCEHCATEMRRVTVAAIGYHENAAGQKLKDTCVADGTEGEVITDSICKHCGEQIVADHADLEERSFPATCTTYSYTLNWCTACGYQFVDNVGNTYGGHNFEGSAWIVDVPNGVGVEGHQYRECANGCGEIDEETIPALEGIEFSYAIQNAIDGTTVIANSNTIKVIISTKASSTSISNLVLNLGFDTSVLTFIEGEFKNELFVVGADGIDRTGDVVITPAVNANANGWVSISVDTNDNLDATVNSSAVLAVLTFQVNNVLEDGKVIDLDVLSNSSITNDEGDLVDAEFGSVDEVVPVKLGYLAGNSDILANDAQKLVNIAKSAEYNVAADIDKDGEITLVDYGYLRQYIAGILTYEQLCAISADAE